MRPFQDLTLSDRLTATELSERRTRIVEDRDDVGRRRPDRRPHHISIACEGPIAAQAFEVPGGLVERARALERRRQRRRSVRARARRHQRQEPDHVSRLMAHDHGSTMRNPARWAQTDRQHPSLAYTVRTAPSRSAISMGGDPSESSPMSSGDCPSPIAFAPAKSELVPRESQRSASGQRLRTLTASSRSNARSPSRGSWTSAWATAIERSWLMTRPMELPMR
jgi:hypothetical protein